MKQATLGFFFGLAPSKTAPKPPLQINKNSARDNRPAATPNLKSKSSSFEEFSLQGETGKGPLYRGKEKENDTEGKAGDARKPRNRQPRDRAAKPCVAPAESLPVSKNAVKVTKVEIAQSSISSGAPEPEAKVEAEMIEAKVEVEGESETEAEAATGLEAQSASPLVPSSVPSPAQGGLSSYEQLREDNMRRNAEFLASLGLDAVQPRAKPKAASTCVCV